MLVSPKDLNSVSPYAFEFYRKSDNKQLDKWEIFSIFERNPNDLTAVCLNKHKIYGRRAK
jgi:hypothetical protein